jgi:hypothetical protein
MEELIRYISIPFAIKLFKEDKELFRGFKTPSVYLDKLDAAIDQLRHDFYNLKVKYNQVRKIDVGKYKFKGKIYEFSAAELKQETADIMKEYLFTVEAVYKERVWGDQDDRFKG